jgi:hypothetical protein
VGRDRSPRTLVASGTPLARARDTPRPILLNGFLPSGHSDDDDDDDYDDYDDAAAAPSACIIYIHIIILYREPFTLANVYRSYT